MLHRAIDRKSFGATALGLAGNPGMQVPDQRFYSFVSRFVSAVTTSALTQEIERSRRFRAMMTAAYGDHPEPTAEVEVCSSRLRGDEVLAA